MAMTKRHTDDDEVFAAAMQLASSSVLPMVLKAAVELKLFEIIASSEQKVLSAAEIALQISTQNASAPAMVERILRFLASSSVLKCEVIKKPDGERVVLYGLNPVCKYFVEDENGVSLAPFLLFLQDKVVLDSWCHLKDGVVDGVIPFNKAHGMSAFEYPAKDHRFNKLFNQAMHSLTTNNMNKMFEAYKGFENLTQIIDVGGGTGTTVASIVSRYPNIRGINFDLPHVIQDAPHFEGVEHVAGDMFESVPSGDVMFLKYILHDWSDEECLKLLNNCCNALSESGKLIVLESLLPQYPDTDDISNNIFRSDLNMLTLNPGGKERTESEYEDLARSAGFARIKVICEVHSNCVIEFYKM